MARPSWRIWSVLCSVSFSFFDHYIINWGSLRPQTVQRSLPAPLSVRRTAARIRGVGAAVIIRIRGVGAAVIILKVHQTVSSAEAVPWTFRQPAILHTLSMVIQAYFDCTSVGHNLLSSINLLKGQSTTRMHATHFHSIHLICIQCVEPLSATILCYRARQAATDESWARMAKWQRPSRRWVKDIIEEERTQGKQREGVQMLLTHGQHF